MEDGYCIIMTATESQEEANRLAEMLVTTRLAACVQTLPITSTYTWQDTLTCSPEWLLMIKTIENQYQAIQDTILKHHSYETPEIIRVPIGQGSPSYLDWIDAQTKPIE